ncbi:MULTISPECIES: GNAT family N-acetyltransferase [Actinomadura]|uniref:GNAT family N-acetyltransferase n=1 Tax=Actinomadura litoris TaxID=2678616 RepID=A0A7K1LA99_9ACTN|nr:MULTISPECIES: GNAT family protein [Actinomadura]MBT2213250.1 GNAT family N-acetyltransferase [Actinomadura sp. NEAU-AAG7]MUN41349.1 GNAT family N-acetyltransferase [Actinomadura litoris]
MDVIALDDPTDARIRQWHDVLMAVHTADSPGDPAPEPEQTAERLLGGFGSRQRLWGIEGEDAGLVAVAALRLPGEAGAVRPAEIDIRVRPEYRRRGLGRRLMAAAANGLRADGRTSVIAQVLAGTPAVPFLESHGFECVLTLRGMLLDLADLPPGLVARLLAEAPAGYRLVRWSGVVPDEHASALARVKTAMADLAEYEGTPWDADRVREMAELVAKRGDDLYTVAVLDGDAIAGFTEVVVPLGAAGRAAQYDTAVAPEHRGRRLGILVKAAMLRWLAEERPDVREIETDNVGDNTPMLAVNEELGFRVERESREYQAAVSALP